MSDESIGVVVAHDDQHVVEEVAELLEAAPDLFVAATSPAAAAPGGVVVAGGALLLDLVPMERPVVALADGELVTAARAALAVGAADIVRWPDEAERLGPAIRRAAHTARAGGTPRGKIVAVAGARGGAGCSTVVAALAASMRDAVVVDLEGGQRMFAADADEAVGRATDASALVPHVGRSRCLHKGPAYAAHVARALATVAVVDAGRVPGANAVLASADVRVLVVPNDVASVRAAAAASPTHVIFRRVRRDGVALRDAIASIGIEKAVVVPEDRMLARAVDLGRLPLRGSRAMRVLSGFARGLEAV